MSLMQAILKVQSELELVWPNGREPSCCPLDGEHYSLPGQPRPVSISKVESHLLYNLVIATASRSVFEVGTGFGYSSLWLAAAVHSLYGAEGWVGSIDNYSEGGRAGESTARHQVAQALAKRLNLSETVTYFVGESPSDLSSVIWSPLDLVFIDGNHHGEQPTLDYQGLRPFLTSDSLIVWHDVQSKYSVANGIANAIKDGWSPVTLPTSCRMTVCYRTFSSWEKICQAFNEAMELRTLPNSA